MSESCSVACRRCIVRDNVGCSSSGWAVCDTIENQISYSLICEVGVCREGTVEGGGCKNGWKVVPGVVEVGVMEAEGNGVREERGVKRSGMEWRAAMYLVSWDRPTQVAALAAMSTAWFASRLGWVRLGSSGGRLWKQGFHS